MLGQDWLQRSYYEALDRGELPIVRGFLASDDDIVRREIMFNFILYEMVDKADIQEKFPLKNFDDYFAVELELLAEFVEDGLVDIDDKKIRITDAGRFYQRQVCQIFDVYDRAHG